MVAPMTISDEEHVARAIFAAAGYGYAWDTLQAYSKGSYCAQARAAIAAMPAPAEAMRAEIDWLKRAGSKQGQRIADSVEIEIKERAEAIRAKTIDECEEIAREEMESCQANYVLWESAAAIAAAIAALKGKP